MPDGHSRNDGAGPRSLAETITSGDAAKYFGAVILVLLIVAATIQLIAPGFGDSWFGANCAPDGWDPSTLPAARGIVPAF